MKGLYCKPGGDQGDLKFVLQETNAPTNIGNHQVKVQVKSCALSPVDFKLYEDLKLENEHVPVGREITGVVLQVGAKVTFFQPDDEVVGILPLDAEQSGLCSVVLIDEYHLVQKPEKVSWFEAAAVIKDGLRAYTALHTLARMAAGQTVLVLDGAGPAGVLAIQLAHYHGVKVLATALSPDDQKFLEELRPSVVMASDVFSFREHMKAIITFYVKCDDGFHMLKSNQMKIYMFCLLQRACSHISKMCCNAGSSKIQTPSCPLRFVLDLCLSLNSLTLFVKSFLIVPFSSSHFFLEQLFLSLQFDFLPAVCSCLRCAGITFGSSDQSLGLKGELGKLVP